MRITRASTAPPMKPPMRPRALPRTSASPSATTIGEERRARTVEHAAEHVAPILVGAEEMLRGGWRQGVRQILVVGIVRDEERRRDGQEQEGEHDRETELRLMTTQHARDGGVPPISRGADRPKFHSGRHARRIRGSSSV